MCWLFFSFVAFPYPYLLTLFLLSLLLCVSSQSFPACTWQACSPIYFSSTDVAFTVVVDLFFFSISFLVFLSSFWSPLVVLSSYFNLSTSLSWSLFSRKMFSSLFLSTMGDYLNSFVSWSNYSPEVCFPFHFVHPLFLLLIFINSNVCGSNAGAILIIINMELEYSATRWKKL